MVRIADDETDIEDEERLARSSDQARSGWEQTLADLDAMVADREEAGYEVVKIVAGDTAPKNPDSGDSEEWGLAYVIPGNHVDDFEEIYEQAAFEETAVYQASSGPFQFIVTEVVDHDNELVLFIAGSYELRFAPELVRTAMDRGRMYSHVKTLDGTHLGTIKHDDPGAFFPDPETFYAYESGA
jgi:hypothetical protein